MSPKLNGVNGEYRIDDDITLLSRGGEIYPEIPHIAPDIAEICRQTGETSFNGELYIHGMYLQDITSAVKKQKISSKQLEFHIFDLPRNKEEYDKRLEILGSIETTENVFIVEVLVAYNHEDIENFHQKCVNNGYEGIVVRNSIGLYEYNTKSLNVFKYKIPKEKEFKIINYKIDAYGHPVFECLCREQINLENNKNQQRTFWVTPKGTHEQKLEMIEEINSYLNSWYTVEFETYSKDMVPQKPIGIRKRKCDENGEALE
jgi:ATP-dependent DNA ligase